MRKADLLSSWGGGICVSLICMIAACSSSPEQQPQGENPGKLLNGAWDCKIGDEHKVLRIESANGAIRISEPTGTFEARIVKADGTDLYLASPAEKEPGLIRFTDDNSFTLQDAGNPDRAVYACKRQSK